MKVSFSFDGKVEDKKLQLYHRDEFINRLSYFDGKHVLITIEEKKKQRSLNQNSYYWGAIIPFVTALLKEAGWLLENMQTHEMLKKQFNTRTIVNEQTGEVMEIPGSSANLTTAGFSSYIEKINQFCIENFGAHIPTPNDQNNIQTDFIED